MNARALMASTEEPRVPLRCDVTRKVQSAGVTVLLGGGVALLYLTGSTGFAFATSDPLDALNGRWEAAHYALAASMAVGVALALLLILRCFLSSRPIAIGPCWSPCARIVLACLAFMVVGPALMMLNKHILQDLQFHHPLSLSVLGLVSSSIFSHTVVRLGLATIRPESREAVARRAWYRTALPIGAAKAVTLATGNAAYLFLGLGFIQMLKAFTPAFVVLVMRIFGLTPPSRVAIWAVCLIVVGTLVEVRGELHLTIFGLFLMLSSELMEATNLVLTQQLLQNCKFTVMEGMYALAPPGAACLLAMAAVLEWPTMVREGAYRIVLENPWYFLASSLLGLLVNFLGLAVVQATSSLTLKILNTVRCVGLVFVGVVFYGEDCSKVEVIGYLIALVGFSLYQWAQMYPESGECVERWVMHWCQCLCLEAAQATGSRTYTSKTDFSDDEELGIESVASPCPKKVDRADVCRPE